MKREHNERNAQLMAKYGASAELMATILDLSIDECRRIREATTTRLYAVGERQWSDYLLEQAIAFAIKNAQQMHKESCLTGVNYSEYTIEDEVCFMVACEQQGLPSRVWDVLYLANHWQNVLADWADNLAEYEPTSCADLD